MTTTGAQIARIAGINLCPMVAGRKSYNVAFSTKPLENTYTQAQITRFIAAQKNGARILINPPTVSDPVYWKKTQDMANWARAGGMAVVFCMVDSDLNDVNNNGHGDGKVDDFAAAKQMWATVAKTYQDDVNVYFEAFNEPFGYTDPCQYISAMMQIIPDNVPANRIIINGMGYAADVQKIKDYWPGLLGYHVYPFWITEPSKKTQSNYSNLVQVALAGVADRTFVTEFGADLKLANEDYNNSFSSSPDVQFVKGMHDAFLVLKPKGTFFWHGWDNDDTYSYWAATASAKAKIDALQSY